MRRYRYTPRDDADLDAITEYFSERSPAAGLAFFKDLEHRCRMLATSPKSGRERPGFGSGVRSVVVAKHYVVFFRASDTGIEVLRIVHGSRDIGPEMFEEP